MRVLLAIVAALAVPGAAAPAALAEIVGGRPAQRPYPFMVYLEQGRQEVEPAELQFCGGSLVAPRWVLTAAHCRTTLGITEPDLLVAVAGRQRLSDRAAGERIQARRVIPHPKADGDPEHGFDVMLVELSRPAPGAPVLVAGPGEEPLWAPGRTGTILGWGDTEEGGTGSDMLMEADVPVVDDAHCATDYAWTRRFDPRTMVCAGFPHGGVDTCQGDSGGPILVPAADRAWRLFGVTSYGEGCGRPGRAGVYAEAGGEALRGFVAQHVPEAVAPPPPARSDPPRRRAGGKPRPCGKPKRRQSSRKRACAKRRPARRRG